jgi:hypothetical protein
VVRWLLGDGRSGAGLEGDLVAENLQLADVVALGAFGTDPGVVEANAEVVEMGLWVGQQVPGDDQDGPADRDDRSFLAPSTGDRPVAFTKKGIGLAGGDGGLAKYATQVGVAVPGRSAALALAGGLLDARGRTWPTTPGAQRSGTRSCPPRSRR